MTDAVLIALVGGCVTIASVGTPVVISVITNAAARKSKQQDWDRQDRVAEKAEQVVKQAEEAARLLKATNESIVTAATATNDKLTCLEVGQKQIHTLVNSNLTSALSGELVALKGQLIYLRRLVERESNAEDVCEVDSLVAQIAELETALADRLKQTTAANAEAAKDKPKGT